MTQLAHWLPRYDYAEHHEIFISADLARVRRALAELDVSRIPLVRLLMTLRMIPALLVAPSRTVERLSKRRSRPVGLTTLDGFVLLADEPTEIVLGVTGRFWKSQGEILESDPATFLEPPPTGTARAAINILLVPRLGGGTQVSTDTRIHCADPSTRRIFGWYWRAIRLGSGVIRIALLRTLRRASEEDDR